MSRAPSGLRATTEVGHDRLQFVELPDEDRKEAGRLGKLAKRDQVEVRASSAVLAPINQILSLLPEAAALNEMLLGRLSQGERVATVNLPDPDVVMWLRQGLLPAQR